MSEIAYELREEFAGTVEQEIDGEIQEVDLFQGGVINLGDVDGESRDLDVKLALEEGAGRIVVDELDTQAVLALNGSPALKRVGAEEGEELTVESPVVLYPDRNRDELRGDAKSRGIDGASSAVKDDLVYALEEHDIRTADGTLAEVSPLSIETLAAARLEREEA